jgi:hypothetical protein
MRRMRNAIRSVMVVSFSFLAIGCRPSQQAIVFSKVPVADAGGPDGLDWIKGRVLRTKPDQRIVLYAHSVGLWYLQPASSRPFTEIKQDLTWESVIHLGDRYAALLVAPGYIPTNKMPELPTKGGSVLAVVTVPGTAPHAKTIHFSGYNWEARQKYSNRDGKLNPYDPANAWVDTDGFLHLNVVSRDSQWFGAEVSLQQSLGHGIYHLTVRDVSHLDSAAVLTMYTWGYPDRFNREVDVEVSRFGDPEAKFNGQFVVQPYYEPSNISHFEVPPGLTTFSFHWEPGAVLFDASRGLPGLGVRPFASHRFDSGVPDPGGESVRISLHAFGKARIPMKDPTEVIIESFSYSP